MPAPVIGLIVGVLLAIAATTGGFGGFVLALVLGAIGYLVTAQLTGKMDIPGMFKGGKSG